MIKMCWGEENLKYMFNDKLSAMFPFLKKAMELLLKIKQLI